MLAFVATSTTASTAAASTTTVTTAAAKLDNAGAVAKKENTKTIIDQFKVETDIQFRYLKPKYSVSQAAQLNYLYALLFGRAQLVIFLSQCWDVSIRWECFKIVTIT